MRVYLIFAAICIFIIGCKTKVVYLASNNIPIDKRVQDSTLIFHTMGYRKVIDSAMQAKVAYLPNTWVKALPESALGNWCADAVLWQAQKMADSFGYSFPVASILNYGGLRASLPQGTLTLRNFYELMPFENALTLIAVKGSEINNYANYVKQKGGMVAAGFLYNVLNDNILINEYEIDTQQVYWIASSDYLANGGDEMAFLTENANRIDLKISIREAFINYARHQGTLKVLEQKRYITAEP